MKIKLFNIQSREKLLRNNPQGSRVAQWKRAGPITQRSVDRNHALLRVDWLILQSFFFLLDNTPETYTLLRPTLTIQKLVSTPRIKRKIIKTLWINWLQATCNKKIEKKSSRGKSTPLAERGFDPRTSGLWAQHASTAPLCFDVQLSTKAQRVANFYFYSFNYFL